MYGVPADLDLSLLRVAELTQVCLGLFDVQFRFRPIGAITVTGGWELFDDTGVSVDHGANGGTRELFEDGNVSVDHALIGGMRPPFQLHRLLGQKIVGITITAPQYLELMFGNGDRLRLIDNSEQYESFTIDLHPQAGLIVV